MKFEHCKIYYNFVTYIFNGKSYPIKLDKYGKSRVHVLIYVYIDV